MICHSLHNFGGHEYMYTKEICKNLDESFEPLILGRKDTKEKICAELNVKKIFSVIKYNQEQSFLTKMYKLILRELLWYKEIISYLATSEMSHNDVVFVHTFSIYNIFSWLFIIPKIRKKGAKLILLFRYSKILLPDTLKILHVQICKLFPEPNKRLVYLCDSEELRKEYLESSNLKLEVVPVMAKTEFKRKNHDTNDTITLSYLGAARNDKGFYLLPEIIQAIENSGKFNVNFVIQSSFSGTNFMESKCSTALEKLIEISNKNTNITLFENQLDDDTYDKLLLTTDLMLLPYTGETYKIQTSGILIESMANGIPCIVPKDTWMEKELNISGGGVSFNPQKMDGPGKAVIKVLDDYDHFKNLALKNMDEIKVLHGPKAQTNKIMEFC